MMTQITDNELNNISGGTKIPYIVQPGDTLGDLAKKFNCSIDDICRWNDIKNPDVIMVNQQLIFKF